MGGGARASPHVGVSRRNEESPLRKPLQPKKRNKRQTEPASLPNPPPQRQAAAKKEGVCELSKENRNRKKLYRTLPTNAKLWGGNRANNPPQSRAPTTDATIQWV